MIPKSLPTAAAPKARCPVCHEIVYSRGNIHPQCAVKQSEMPAGGKKTAAPAVVTAPVAKATEA